MDVFKIKTKVSTIEKISEQAFVEATKQLPP